MEMQTQRVVLETARHRIVGDLTLPREGYRSRISDFLNRGDQAFFAVANATLEDLRASGDGETVELDFIAIGARHVELAYPAPD